MKGVAAWRAHPRVRRAESSWAGRLGHALYRGNLRDRALTLAGQAFTALVPLLIVLATLASSGNSSALADWLIHRFSLQGDTADAVRQLFARPPDATSGVSVIGTLVLLISVAGFARSVQRTYEISWELPPRARWRTPLGLAGGLLLGSTLGITAWMNTVFWDLPAGRLWTLAGQLVVGVPAWWLVSWLLLSGRIGWRVLLPGATVSAGLQALTSWVGSIWVPSLLKSNTEQYGVIGVALTIISWLVVLAFLVVASAVVGAHVGHRLAEQRAVPPEPHTDPPPEQPPEPRAEVLPQDQRA